MSVSSSNHHRVIIVISEDDNRSKRDLLATAASVRTGRWTSSECKSRLALAMPGELNRGTKVRRA